MNALWIWTQRLSSLLRVSNNNNNSSNSSRWNIRNLYLMPSILISALHVSSHLFLIILEIEAVIMSMMRKLRLRYAKWHSHNYTDSSERTGAEIRFFSSLLCFKFPLVADFQLYSVNFMLCPTGWCLPWMVCSHLIRFFPCFSDHPLLLVAHTSVWVQVTHAPTWPRIEGNSFSYSPGV